MFRAGLIVPSFGRIVDMLAALELRELRQNQFDLNPTLDEFYFPESSRFPFLTAALKSRLRVSDSIFFRYKFKLGSRFAHLKVPSMNDFVDDAKTFFAEFQSPPLITLRTLNNFNLENISELLNLHQIDLDKLVLVHVRNSDWDISFNKVRDTEFLSKIAHRNSDPTLFIPAINRLLDEGFSVVRIGRDRVPLEINRIKFFDYASSGIQSDYIDFFLWSLALCATSTGSGAHQPALIFGKPLLLVNNGESLKSFLGIRRSQIKVLPKTYYSKKDNRRLSVKDLNDSAIFNDNNSHHSESLDRMGVLIASNDHETISNSISKFAHEVYSNTRLSGSVVDGILICDLWPNLEN